MIRLLAACAAALLLASCGPRAVDARPAMWRVSDGDTEIWLLGTIHALPPGVRWETPAVTQAIDAADTLVTEIPAADPARTAAAFLAAGRGSGLPPLVERVAPAQRAAAAALGGSLDGFRSWAAAVIVGAEGMRAADASADNGVEAVLARRFAGRRHEALETQAGQLALFDALPEAAQRVLLAQALADGLGYAKTLAAWRAGDMAAMAAAFMPAFRGAPVLQDVLVTRRNAAWSDWIRRRMARPGRVLVAVGAGHLAGDRSVTAMLGARGLTVERVE